jgi:hypothetical protein
MMPQGKARYLLEPGFLFWTSCSLHGLPRNYPIEDCNIDWHYALETGEIGTWSMIGGGLERK